MTAPFARFTSIQSGQPLFVDVFSIQAILPVSEPHATAVLMVAIGNDTLSYTVAEDSESAMNIINETFEKSQENA